MSKIFQMVKPGDPFFRKGEKMGGDFSNMFDALGKKSMEDINQWKFQELTLQGSLKFFH